MSRSDIGRETTGQRSVPLPPKPEGLLSGSAAPGRQTTPMDERNRIARECADLRDQRDDLLRQIEKLRDHINIIDDDRRVLCDELEKVTGRNWVDEEARRWSS